MNDNTKNTVAIDVDTEAAYDDDTAEIVHTNGGNEKGLVDLCSDDPSTEEDNPKTMKVFKLVPIPPLVALMMGRKPVGGTLAMRCTLLQDLLKTLLGYHQEVAFAVGVS